LLLATTSWFTVDTAMAVVLSCAVILRSTAEGGREEHRAAR
jgi:hypothetical protein